MLLYETERSDRREYLYCQRDHNFNFPAHLHHSYEFLCVQAGVLVCTVETETYEVGPGQGLLILPDQIHSYRTKGPSESVLWVFSNDWVPDFSAQLGQRIFTKPPDVKIGTTIFSKKAKKNKPYKVSHWVKTIGKPYAAYSYLF